MPGVSEAADRKAVRSHPAETFRHCAIVPLWLGHQSCGSRGWLLARPKVNHIHNAHYYILVTTQVKTVFRNLAFLSLSHLRIGPGGPLWSHLCLVLTAWCQAFMPFPSGHPRELCLVVGPGLAAKVSLLGDLEEHARGVLAALVRDVVAPPVDAHVGDLDGKEDDNGGNGDGGRPRGGKDIVVPRPKGEVARLDVAPREPREHDHGPHVREVVRREHDGAVAEHDGVERADPLVARELLGQEPGD